MNDKTYEQIRYLFSELGAHCIPHINLTAWIRAIQNARILQLRPKDPWTEDESLIQVRRMEEQDLESQVDQPESEHEYEKTLDVIKLPIPIPTENHSHAPQFLYIRPDEYALFKCFGKHNWCILTGNPGISKSWFQWKFILFCYRLDLFYQLSPVAAQLSPVAARVEALMEDEPSSEGHKMDDQTCTEQAQVDDHMEEETASKKLKIEDQTLTEQGEPKVQAELKQDQLFIPKLIFRTVEGKKSFLFFVDQIKDVLYVKHSPEILDCFTDENSTVLWEPGRGKAPVYFTDIKARIIATVSPNQELFHQFRKNAKMFYMPCPSELQLRLMGQIYRSFTQLKNCPSDAEIHQSVKKLGPFIRTVLCWTRDEIALFINDRDNEIDTIVKDTTKLSSKTHIMEPLNGNGLSHRLVRYVVYRNSDESFLGYTGCHYRYTCKEALRLLSVAVVKIGIEKVKKHLISVNQGEISIPKSIPILLERIFEFYALTGLQWKFRQMQLKDSNREIHWENFIVKFYHVERTKTLFQNMVADVLYYPHDPTFPLVDLYYKDEFGKLVGIQATMSKVHAKRLSTYQRFYDEIGTNPENTSLMLYYFILPHDIEHFDKFNFSPGQFWKDVGSGIESRWKNNISFFALVPPADFEAYMP